MRHSSQSLVSRHSLLIYDMVLHLYVLALLHFVVVCEHYLWRLVFYCLSVTGIYSPPNSQVFSNVQPLTFEHKVCYCYYTMICQDFCFILLLILWFCTDGEKKDFKKMLCHVTFVFPRLF